jgi:hypothetical protein
MQLAANHREIIRSKYPRGMGMGIQEPKEFFEAFQPILPEAIGSEN